MGDGVALLGVLAASFALLAAVIAIVAPRFGEYAIAAAGVDTSSIAEAGGATAFRATSPRRALRRKEWTLLRRDPWLVSQTLMQMLYLIPPAVLLWRSFDDGNGAFQLLVPVLVMAAGQLAGGLAWLAISGEDAPDLVATAPVPADLSCAPKSRPCWASSPSFSRRWLRRWPSPRPGMRWSRPAASSSPPRRRPRSSSGSAPRPSAASSPPPGILAGGDFRRGFFVDRLGRHGRSRRRQPLACRRAGPDRAGGARRRLVHEPAARDTSSGSVMAARPSRRGEPSYDLTWLRRCPCDAGDFRRSRE